MMSHFAFWSPLISLLSVSLLYPLRLHTRNSNLIRFFAGLFLFPALVSSIYIVKATSYNNAVINKSSKISNVPITLEFQLNNLNSPLILSAVLLITAFIFLLPLKKITENLSTIEVSLGLLCTMAAISDQFLKMALFSMGAIIIIFMIMNDEYNILIIKHIMADFFIQRATDLLAFIALLIILTNTQTSNTARALYFTAIIVKLISVFYLDTNKQIYPDITLRESIFYKIYIGIGSQILLLQISPIILTNSLADLFFIIPAVTAFLLTLLIFIIKYNRSRLSDHILNISISALLIVICTGNALFAVPIICGILIFYPLCCLPEIIETGSSLNISQPPLLAHRTLAPSIFIQIFLQLPFKIIYLLAKLFINFLNPIYAGFLLYRMPQIFIIIVQLPLRLLHNGNIQRSMFFVSIMLISYIYWWGWR